MVTFRKNAEYDEAKNEQAEVEARINEIEYMLKYARVIDDERNQVRRCNSGFKGCSAIFGGEEKVHKSSGSTEADPYKEQAIILNHLSVRLVLTERQAKL